MGPINISSIPPQAPTVSEDCLFLDAVVPKSIFDSNGTRDDNPQNVILQCEVGKICTEIAAKAPVLVWINGGGYAFGSKMSAGNPAGLIARSLRNGSEGVIFVAMNYRLGLFMSIFPILIALDKSQVLMNVGLACWQRQHHSKCRTSRSTTCDGMGAAEHSPLRWRPQSSHCNGRVSRRGINFASRYRLRWQRTCDTFPASHSSKRRFPAIRPFTIPRAFCQRPPG